MPSPQSPISIFLRNLFSSWFGLAVSTLIAFFLSPFVVHSLGDFRYGIWSIVLSVVGYMGLADVGLRRSITRFINYYLGRNETSHAIQIISTSLGIILVVNVLVLLTGVVCAFFFPLVFEAISREYLDEIRIVILIGACELCLGLIGSVFRRSIEAFDRFEVVNAILVGYMLLRTFLVVSALNFFPSLISLSVASFFSQSIASIFFAVFAFRIWPELKIGKRFFEKEMALKLMSFGWPTFLDNISARIINYTDLILIGILFGPKLVTMYSIGQIVAVRFEALYSKIVVVLTPTLFKKTGVSDDQAVIFILNRLDNAISFITIPFICGFATYGSDFFLLWMGAEYVESAQILTILAFSSFFTALASPARVVLLGKDREKLVAGISSIQAIANLCLSIFFASICKMGILGVAFGTLVPSILINGFLMPVILSRNIGVSLRTLVQETYLRWLLPVVLYYFVCYFSNKFFEVTSWGCFFMNVILLGIIYCPIGFWFILDDYSQNALLRIMKSKLLKEKEI